MQDSPSKLETHDDGSDSDGKCCVYDFMIDLVWKGRNVGFWRDRSKERSWWTAIEIARAKVGWWCERTKEGGSVRWEIKLLAMVVRRAVVVAVRNIDAGMEKVERKPEGKGNEGVQSVA